MLEQKGDNPKSHFERFTRTMRALIAVPKAELDKKLEEDAKRRQATRKRQGTKKSKK